MTGSTAGHVDVAAVGFGQCFDDGQSDAGASSASVARGIGAVEPLEDVRHVFGGDAFTVVGNREHRVGSVPGGGEGDVTSPNPLQASPTWDIAPWWSMTRRHWPT